MSHTYNVICVGASHRTATVAALERAMRRAELARALFGAIDRDDALPTACAELAILTTCNRVELYVACDSPETRGVARSLRHLLSDESGEAVRLYEHRGDEAVRHLCRVASGLDSLVIGEPEIAGQVSRAFELVLHRNGGPPLLASVARTARIAGRRARAETAINHKPASISTVAVQLMAEYMGGLARRRVLVVGAGHMGGVACEVLLAAGADVTVTNRTAERATALAQRAGVRMRPFADLTHALADSDGVMLTTAATQPIIDSVLLEDALRHRSGENGLVMVDIGVPRNIAKEARAQGGVFILDIDDLRSRVEVHLDERRDEVPRVEAIIEEELAAWRRGDTTMLPLIGDLHRYAERVRQRELERALRSVAPHDGDVREQFEHLSRALVNQLLHGPSSRLRAAAGTEQGREYERMVRDLWGLVEPGVPPAP